MSTRKELTFNNEKTIAGGIGAMLAMPEDKTRNGDRRFFGIIRAKGAKWLYR